MLNRFTALMLMATAIIFSACDKDDPPLADNQVQFEAAEQGLATDETSKDITVKLSRNTDIAIPITIELKETGVVYGTQYTTTPAANAGVISLTIPAGSNSVKFTINKKADILLNGDESIEFLIKNAATPVGQTTKIKLSFSSIVSGGTEMTLNGGDGGPSAVNSVYVDLSNNTQLSIDRKSYDLLFASGADFRVLLNNTAGWAVVKTNKTDINTVGEADINAAQMQIGYGFGSLSMIDDVEGDITKNAMGEVAATEAENKVFVINTAGPTFTPPAVTGFKKIRVLRNANGGYTLQHADLSATTFTSVDIAKDSKFNFSFFSFANGIKSVEPPKDRWDFVWGWSWYKTVDAGKDIPYAYSDLVFTNNMNGVQVAEVMTATVSYDNFNETHIAAQTFNNKRDAIGSKWRATTTGVNQPPIGVLGDRFYVIKDVAGNVYKLRWNSFHSAGADGGKRGYPELEFKLIKKA
jgi:hypothetical protein